MEEQKHEETEDDKASVGKDSTVLQDVLDSSAEYEGDLIYLMIEIPENTLVTRGLTSLLPATYFEPRSVERALRESSSSL